MITNETQAIVALINNVIEQAVKDGGDAGGPYNQNALDLMIAVGNLLNHLNLSNDYEVMNSKEWTTWSKIKIVPREDAYSIATF